MRFVVSVCLSVHPSVSALTPEPFKVKGQGQRSGSSSRVKVNFLACSNRYQGQRRVIPSPWLLGFTQKGVCVYNNRADAVDRLLMLTRFGL